MVPSSRSARSFIVLLPLSRLALSVHYDALQPFNANERDPPHLEVVQEGCVSAPLLDPSKTIYLSLPELDR